MFGGSRLTCLNGIFCPFFAFPQHNIICLAFRQVRVMGDRLDCVSAKQSGMLFAVASDSSEASSDDSDDSGVHGCENITYHIRLCKCLCTRDDQDLLSLIQKRHNTRQRNTRQYETEVETLEWELLL